MSISYSRPYIFDVLTFCVIALPEPTRSIESYLKCHYKLAGSQNRTVQLMEQGRAHFDVRGPHRCSRASWTSRGGLLVSVHLQAMDGGAWGDSAHHSGRPGVVSDVRSWFSSRPGQPLRIYHCIPMAFQSYFSLMISQEVSLLDERRQF